MKNPLPRELYWRFLPRRGDDVPCLNPVCIIGNAGEDISALVAEAKNSSGEDGASEEAQSGVKTPEVNDSTEKNAVPSALPCGFRGAGDDGSSDKIGRRLYENFSPRAPSC